MRIFISIPSHRTPYLRIFTFIANQLQYPQNIAMMKITSYLFELLESEESFASLKTRDMNFCFHPSIKKTTFGKRSYIKKDVSFHQFFPHFIKVGLRPSPIEPEISLSARTKHDLLLCKERILSHAVSYFPRKSGIQLC